MSDNVSIWLERMMSVRSSLHRKAAVSAGLQFIHAEILEYLSKCNRYSDTAQALTEYLGLTKGSVSQSLKLLEGKGFIIRKPCPNDKRATRLSLSAAGQEMLSKVLQQLPPLGPDETTESKAEEKALTTILKRWQHKHDLKGFGLCGSCQFNQKLNSTTFRCGLTQDILATSDTSKICREFVF